MESLVDGIALVPVRTPTLPPATHTNTVVVGSGALTVFDPASPYEDEQERLVALLDEQRATGRRVERIVLTHHHHDHVSGAEALRRALGDVPIAAHPATAALVRDRIRVDEPLADGAVLHAGGRTLVAYHTPGHAPGHLVFIDQADGICIAGDLVAGIGTILIDPREGDLGDYLASLARVQDLAPTALIPSHGPVLRQARSVLSFYVAHRHQRSEQIRAALVAHGAATPAELAPRVYTELPASAHGIAAVQITAHLLWMARHGVVREAGNGRYAAAS